MRDIRSLLLAQPGATSPHDRFYYHQGDTLRAVRSGSWKLFRNGQLYNPVDDLSERSNVAAKHADVVRRLAGYMDEFDAEMHKNARPVGVAENPRTLLPRQGVEGEAAFTPTLTLGKEAK